MLNNLLLVGAGGFLGSAGRYLVQRWISNVYEHAFPLGTFLVNISGCFFIGVIFALAERTDILSPQTRLFLVTGFCGGYTTFSTFSFENMQLLRTGDAGYLLLYVAGSVVLGVLAVFAGILCIKLLLP